MIKYETVKEEIIEFGKNNFIEISQKVTKGSEYVYTVGTSNTFISIARGYMRGENKIYKHSIAIPHDKDILGKIAESIFKFSRID